MLFVVFKMLFDHGFCIGVFRLQFNIDCRSNVTRKARVLQRATDRKVEGWFVKVDNRFGYEKL